MANSTVLVAYDVSNDKARSKVVRLLDRYGRRVQKSVYEMSLSKSKAIMLVGQIRELFFKLQSARYHTNGQTLSIIVIPVCKNCSETSIRLGAEAKADNRFLVL